MGKGLVILVVVAFAIFAAPVARAVNVGHITRLSGQRSNVLTGLGLVVGLNSTGDGGDFLPAIRPLAQMLAKFNDKADPRDLANVANVALVSITVMLPPRGVHDGDTLDVYVTSIGPATSLRGGRLFQTPLVGPDGKGEVLALAQGDVVLEDPTSPNRGVVPKGALMEFSFRPEVVHQGRLTLVLQDAAADWTTASTIAKIISDGEGDGSEIAVAIDERTVVVSIPAAERERPSGFISRIQRLPVPQLPTEARVQINEKTGTIILTGDVEISPVVISHRGLTIQTVNPPPAPTPRTPVIGEKRAIGIDTTGQGGARLQDLVDAMDLIRVPAEDRIQIIKELHRIGKIHAKLVISGQNE